MGSRNVVVCISVCGHKASARKRKSAFSFILPTRLLAHGVRLYFFFVWRFVNPAPRKETEEEGVGLGRRGEGGDLQKKATRFIVKRLFVCSATRGGYTFSSSDLGKHENAVNSGFPYSLPFVQDEVQTERLVHVE